MSSDNEKIPGVCGQVTEVFSRCVGYLRPVQQWNKGRKSEYAKRRLFTPSGELPEKPGYITDGYAYWSEICPNCGGKTMSVVRPGMVQCSKCG